MLKGVLTKRGLATGLGDEGGFAPDVGNEEAVRLLLEAVEQAGYAPGRDLAIALDVAATELYDSERRVYTLAGDGRTLQPRRDGRLPRRPHRRYPIVSIEDGLAEDDWAGWKSLTDGHRGPGAAGRRRPVRHPVRAPRTGHRRGDRQRHPGQGQPGRDPHRDPRHHGRRRPGRLPVRRVAPLRRERGHHHRRPGGGHQLRPDQDGGAGPVRAGGQVQPAAADRGRARARPPCSGEAPPCRHGPRRRTGEAQRRPARSRRRPAPAAVTGTDRPAPRRRPAAGTGGGGPGRAAAGGDPRPPPWPWPACWPSPCSRPRPTWPSAATTTT